MPIARYLFDRLLAPSGRRWRVTILFLYFVAVCLLLFLIPFVYTRTAVSLDEAPARVSAGSINESKQPLTTASRSAGMHTSTTTTAQPTTTTTTTTATEFPSLIDEHMPMVQSNMATLCHREFNTAYVCPLFFPLNHKSNVWFYTHLHESWQQGKLTFLIPEKSYIPTPFLRALCKLEGPSATSGHETSNVDTCPLRQSVTFSEPIKPLPLRVLNGRLRTAGGAECVVGPLNSSDLMAVPISGPQGTPRWSVFRRECEGRYRDLTRLEVVSVLYHYSRLHAESAVPGQRIGRGFLISGDSMMREMLYRLVYLVRGTVHQLDGGKPLLYVLHTTHDEVSILPCINNEEAMLNNLGVSLPDHTRCIVQAYYPGLLSWVPPHIHNETKCQAVLRDVLIVAMLRWDTYPEHVSEKVVSRFPVSPAATDGYLFWVSKTSKSVDNNIFIDKYFSLMNTHYKRVLDSHAASAVSFSYAYVYLTSPMMSHGGRLRLSAYALNTVVDIRNRHLRELPWQPFSSTRKGDTDKEQQQQQQRVITHPKVNSYLLDFGALDAFMRDRLVTVSDHHFMCDGRVAVTDGHFCSDSMNYILLQWWVRIMGNALAVNMN